MAYSVLMMDLAKSRALNEDNRIDAQKRLLLLCDIVNTIFDKDTKKQLKFSSGDAIQGLYTNVQSAYLIYQYVSHAMYPYKIRGSIGIGDVDQHVLNDQTLIETNQYYGSAYYYASEGLMDAKKRHEDIHIVSKKSTDYAINQLLNQSPITFTTVNRRMIYALINVIYPMFMKHQMNKHYFQSAKPIIIALVHAYHDAKEKRNKKYVSNISNQPNVIEKTRSIEHHVNEIIQENLNQLLKANTELSAVTETDILSNKRVIHPVIKEVIIQLLGFSSQNLNKIIKESQIEHLRKNVYAYLDILKNIYGG